MTTPTNTEQYLRVTAQHLSHGYYWLTDLKAEPIRLEFQIVTSLNDGTFVVCNPSYVPPVNPA